jgi:D-apiose dehydrogenase
MSRFKIAIVGSGGVSRLHAAAYLRHPDRIEVVAAVDPVFDHAKQLSETIPGCVAFDGVGAAVRSADWDIGVVCCPTPARVAVVDELVGAGKHVFVEKPFADNLADATKMVEACEAAGVSVAVHQNFRYHYPFDLARQVILAGGIGPVTTVAHRELMFRQDEGWRTTTPRHSLTVMGIHWLDGFRWMLDDEPVSVLCSVRSSPLVRADGDTEAVVHASFARGTAVSYVESFSYPGREVDTVVIGEKGSLRLDDNWLCHWAVDGRATPEVIRRPNPLGPDKPEATFLAIDQFLQALETGTVPSNSGRDNLRTMAFLEAAYRSAEEGQEVAVVVAAADAEEPVR